MIMAMSVLQIKLDENQDGIRLLDALHEAQRLAYENGVANLSEEEIEAEIKAARAERKMNKWFTL